MKLTALGSSGHQEEPQPMCHKALVLSLAAVWFIGRKSILVCKGAPLDQGMMAVPLFLNIASAAEKDDGEQRFGVAQDSARVKLQFYFPRSLLCNIVKYLYMSLMMTHVYSL